MLRSIKIMEQLRDLGGAPGVQLQQVPPDYAIEREVDEDKKDPDVRIPGRIKLNSPK